MSKLSEKLLKKIQKMDLEDKEKDQWIKYSENVYLEGYNDGKASKEDPIPPKKKLSFFEQLDAE